MLKPSNDLTIFENDILYVPVDHENGNEENDKVDNNR